MIKVTKKLLLQIYAHGQDTYPEECCGIMIAAESDISKIVSIRKMKNVHKGPRETRYSIDPLDLMNLEDELDGLGQSIVGIYHSHPDHPAKPSKFDLQYAWPRISYLVMGTVKGVTETATSWILDNELHVFVEEEIRII